MSSRIAFFYIAGGVTALLTREWIHSALVAAIFGVIVGGVAIGIGDALLRRADLA